MKKKALSLQVWLVRQTGRQAGVIEVSAKGQKQLPAYVCTVTSALTFERPNDFPLADSRSRDQTEQCDWLRRCPFEPWVDQSRALLNSVLPRMQASTEDDSFQK